MVQFTLLLALVWSPSAAMENISPLSYQMLHYGSLLIYQVPFILLLKFFVCLMYC